MYSRVLRITGQFAWARRTFSSLSKIKVVHHQSATVHIVPVLSDNYSYIVVENDTGIGTVVDVGESKPVLDVVEKLMDNGSILELNYALSTHHHDDHVGGNRGLVTRFAGIEIYGTGYESIPHRTKAVLDGNVFAIGKHMQVETIHTPCHTIGHTCFYVSSTDPTNYPLVPMLFSGDTLFVGGCGRFFEGSPLDMLTNMTRLSHLPPQTKVYCGHEYTLANLQFLNSLCKDEILPEKVRAAIRRQYEDCVRLREGHIPTVPSTLGDELVHNLFMRCHDSATQRLMSAVDAEDCMRKLREIKNKYIPVA